MQVVIPYKPRHPQNKVHPELEAHRFSVVVAHRRLGKTVMALNHMIKMALLNTRNQPRYAYIAPFLKQAKLIAWQYLKHYTSTIPGAKPNESELSIELPNKAKIHLFGGDNPDALKGTYLDGVIMDEYAQMKPDLFGETIRPTLSDRNGWALWIGTPKGQNAFYEIYQMAQRNMAKGDPNWYCAMYRGDETGIIPEEELRQLRDVLSDATYRQEILCDFSAAADNVLITIDLVTTACYKKYTEGDVFGAPRILGVDPARFGDDRAVIIRRQGLQAFTPKIYTKIDNMTFVARIVDEILDWNPDATFIDAGRGEGVIDRLRQLGYEHIFEVNFGGSPMQPAVYANKRAEIWDNMKQWIIDGGALPNLPDLKADLVVPTYDYDSANRMRLESNDKIKERLGKSPDIASALAVTFAMPVKVKVNAYGQNVGHKLEFAKSDPVDIFA